MRRILAALAGVAIACAACGSPEPPDVILVLIDTLRADHVGAYGHPRRVTPWIDSIAARGFVFERAYAASSWTNASVASLLTSRYQTQHGVVDFASTLQPSEVVLAEVLRGAGYATGGFSAHTGISTKRGFDQGFVHFDDVNMRRAGEGQRHWLHERASEVNRRALAWLDSLSERRPTFLYLHYMEPHPPYQPTPGAVARLVARESWPLLPRVNSLLRFGVRDPADEDMMGAILEFYDAEIFSLDHELAALFRELERRGLLANSLVVIVSDHGEEFRERGGIGHGMTLYDEVIHVPLIVARAGLSPGRSADVVSLVDVGPTIADFAGVAPVPDSFAGRSLRSLIEGRDEDRRAVLTELERAPLVGAARTPAHRRALVAGDWKLIAGREGQGDAIYHLKEDPGERSAQAGLEGDRRRLRELLARAVERASRNPAARAPRPIDAESLEQLQALGYAD